MGGEIKQFRNFVFGEYCGICLFALWRFAINRQWGTNRPIFSGL